MESLQKLRFSVAENIEKYSVEINVFKISYLFLSCLFIISGFLSVINVSRFTKNLSAAMRLLSWYEFMKFTVDYILHSNFTLKEIIQNPHQRLSIIMGLFSTYRCTSYILALCYLIVYARRIQHIIFLLTKDTQNRTKDNQKDLTEFIASLEIFTLFELCFWSLIKPSSAEQRLIIFEYYAVIISYCYETSNVHKKIWDSIKKNLRNAVSQISNKNKEILNFFDEVIKRVANITKFIGNLG